MGFFKRKKKELSEEEAIEMAIEERKEFWIDSPPLFTGIIHGKTPGIHPLEPSFVEKSWLLFIVDPTQIPTENLMAYLAEWHTRFSEFGLQILLALRIPYPKWLEKKTVDRYMEKHELDFPVVLDNDSAIANALKADELPKLVFIDKGKVELEVEGTNWFNNVELKFHEFLRKTDPGLPLSTPFRPKTSLGEQTGEIEFGKGKGANIVIKEKLEAQLEENSERRWTTLLEGDAVAISGEWKQDGQSIVTEDPKAEIWFRCKHKGVAILAQALTPTGEYSKAVVEVEGVSLIEIFAGEDLKYDEMGNSTLELRTLQIRQIAKELPENQEEFRIRFIHAKRVPVALFGIRYID